MVQAFSFDAESGDIVFERKAVGIPAEMGTPDGMAMDEEGMLWIAHWGGFGVYRWNPLNGKLISKIEVPAPQVSSCAFWGKDLDELIITTARENMTMEEWRKFPHSGDVFIAKPGVKGIPLNKCRV
jgi:sugar lactone lactonase YvrE